MFPQLVHQELTRARILHEGPIHNVAEGFAILYEELEEFWEEVRTKPQFRDPADMLKELVQLAAMCQRTAEDCNLVR